MKKLIIPIIFYILAAVCYTATMITRKPVWMFVGSGLFVIGAIIMIIRLHKK